MSKNYINHPTSREEAVGNMKVLAPLARILNPGIIPNLLVCNIVSWYTYFNNPVYQHGFSGLAGAAAVGVGTSVGCTLAVGAGLIGLKMTALILDKITNEKLSNFLHKNPIKTYVLLGVLLAGPALGGGRAGYTKTDKFVAHKLSQSARHVPQAQPARPMTMTLNH